MNFVNAPIYVDAENADLSQPESFLSSPANNSNLNASNNQSLLLSEQEPVDYQIERVDFVTGKPITNSSTNADDAIAAGLSQEDPRLNDINLGTFDLNQPFSEELAKSEHSAPLSYSAQLQEGDPLLAPIRINAGGDRYTDKSGNLWQADTFYDDGWTRYKDKAIWDTPDDPLYRSERYARTLDYSVPVENGIYDVNLLFAETLWSKPGKRSFDIEVEGRSVASNVDIYSKVGKYKAFTQSVKGVSVKDGRLDIALESDKDYAKLSAFEILSVAKLSQDTPREDQTNNQNATIRYITPTGKGDGSSWDNAESILDLNKVIQRSKPGDEIWIAGDRGTYDMRGQEIKIDSGGDGSAPIYIRGVASRQGGNDEPLFVGDRAKDWQPGKADGRELFRLLRGADHLHFSNLDFSHFGNGVFKFGGDITGVTLHDMEVENVRRFVENDVSGGAKTASVNDLTIRDIDILGFSKSAIRLRYDSNNILIEDVYGDSQGQDGDNFAMGIQLSGTVHDVVHRDVTMKNATQRGSSSDYWNGDGFVTDWGTYNITYEDTFASGNTDGGYDLKSSNTTLIRARAADNKRNFRIWRDATLIDIKSDEPYSRGGAGTTAHIHVLGDEGNATIESGIFSGDEGRRNIVFDLDDRGRLQVNQAVITDNNYELKTVAQGELLLDNVEKS